MQDIKKLKKICQYCIFENESNKSLVCKDCGVLFDNFEAKCCENCEYGINNTFENDSYCNNNILTADGEYCSSNLKKADFCTFGGRPLKWLCLELKEQTMSKICKYCIGQDSKLSCSICGSEYSEFEQKCCENCEHWIDEVCGFGKTEYECYMREPEDYYFMKSFKDYCSEWEPKEKENE